MNIKYTYIFILLFPLCARGQYLIGISTVWNDSFKEWTLIAEEESDDGKLEMRWQLRNDWSEWDFDFAGVRGEIFLKRENDNQHWQARGNGDVVNARTVWPGDRSEWQVSYQDIDLTIRTVIRDIADEWVVEDRRYGTFLVYTDWEGDPRDWIIEDNLSEDIPHLMKIMLVHVVLMQSIPRI